MTTYSRLTVSEQARFSERAEKAAERYGITDFRDYKRLAAEDHLLRQWLVLEANGERIRDDQGKCWWVTGLNTPGAQIRHLPAADLETGAISRVMEIAEKYGLSVYFQPDCRGVCVYVYREADLKGSPIHQVYSTQAHAIYF